MMTVTDGLTTLVQVSQFLTFTNGHMENAKPTEQLINIDFEMVLYIQF